MWSVKNTTVCEGLSGRDVALGEGAAQGADAEQVAEVKVAAPAVEGNTLAALALHGCVAVALRRGSSLVVPNGSTVLRAGDVLTQLGSGEAIAKPDE